MPTKIDTVVIFVLPILAVIISFFVKPTFFTSIFLFLALPGLYLSVRAPKYILKSLVFSLLAGIPLMVILEYIGGASSAWAFPSSVFDFYLLGRVSTEVVLWAFFNIYTVVIFYEFMFDHHKKVSLWNRKMWALVWYLVGWSILFVFLFVFMESNIVIPYFYLSFGVIVFFLPIIIATLSYRRILPKMAYSLVYFSYLSLLYEITALNLGWWYFPGKEFVGHITLFNISFPLEELVFWIILFAPAVISAFEYLDDDCK